MKEGNKIIKNYEDFMGEDSIVGEKFSNINIVTKKKNELDSNSTILILNQITDRIECLDKLINKLDTRIDKLNSRLEKFDNKFNDSYNKLQDKFEERIEKISVEIKETNNKFSEVDNKIEFKLDKTENDKKDRVSLLISGVTLLVLLFTTFFGF